ncbi:LSM7-like protein [Mya arenaria]|uniref:LSM7-like protein n=1 Tax=Mya arenaria TaxID=6604 RepID=A0ABY7G5T8_MYAAR|nr:LSM7-like protein [Mya arenaria]
MALDVALSIEDVFPFNAWLLERLMGEVRDPDDPYKLTEDTRSLGLVVCRGTSVVLICPSDGMEAIANPFIQQEG